MADRIKGITIEIGGDTTKLSDSLKTVNSDLKETQSKLRDVNKALKLDPTNVDLLQQKQKYLQEAIGDTKEKLEQEQTALEQLNAKSAAGEDVTDQQEALQREIVTTKASLEDLQSQSEETGNAMAGDFEDAQESVETLGDKIESAGDKLQDLGSKTSEAGDKISGIGDSLTQNVSQPLQDIASKSVDAWKEVDEAMDTVTTKTGASGDALADMQDQAKNIAKEIPTDFQSAADAVGEVNTRFGSTGDELKDLSTKFIEFASLNDTDVSTSVDKVQSAMAAMNVKTEDAGNFLDTLNGIGQATGVNVLDLAGSISKNGAALNDMGYNADQAAYFLGNLDKNGVDSSTVMAGLKTAYKNAAAEGKSTSDVLAEFDSVMQSNKTDAEKAQYATEVFGSKAGATIAQYVADGKLNFSDLSVSLGDYAGSVQSTYEETIDPLDKEQQALNNLKLVGADLVDAAAPVITDIAETVIPILENVTTWFEGLPDSVQTGIVQVGLFGAAVGPVVSTVGGFVSGLGSIETGIGNMISKLGEGQTAIGNFQGTVSGFDGSKMTSFMNQDVPSACSTMSGTLGTAAAAVGVFAGSFTFTSAVLELTGLDDKLSDVGTHIYDFTHQAQENAAAASDAAITHAQEAIQGTYPVEDAIEELRSAAENATENEKQSMNDLADALAEKYGVTDETLSTASSSVQTASDTISTATSDAASSVEDSTGKMESAWGNMSFEVPKIKLPHFSFSGSFDPKTFSVPHLSVEWYKKAYDNAMVFSQPTVLQTSGGLKGFGDGSGAEIVVGMDNLMKTIKEAVGTQQQGDIVIPVYLGTERIDEIVVKAVQRNQYRSGGR